MLKKPFIILNIGILIILLFSGCSKSDDQREFENQALAVPNGITPTDAGGEPTGSVDPDDWQVGPMYEGRISIGFSDSEAPHPNPLGYNQNLTLNIKFNVSDPVDALEIRKFRLPSDSYYTQLRFYQQDQLSTFNTITIEGQNIAEGPGAEARTTYRLLIYDGNQNLISYGDIEIN